MKKIILLLLCCAMLATLAGCGQGSGATQTTTTTTTIDATTTATSVAPTTTEATAAAETSVTTQETTTTTVQATTGTTTKATTKTTTKPTTKTTTVSSLYKTFTEGKISFQLPSHYKKAADSSPIMYVPETYPQVGDNFNLVVMPKDPTFDSLTEDLFSEQMETLFPGLVVEEFKKTKVAGKSAYRTTYTVSMEGISVTITQVIIDADNTYTLTYSMFNGDLADHVEKCIQSISFK